MFPRIIAFLLACALSAPAHAGMLINSYRHAAPPATSSEQILVSKGTTTFTNNAVRYIPLGYTHSIGATESRFSTFAVAGAATSLRVNVDTPPTGGATWDVTLRKNGSSTALTCQVTSATSGKCTSSTSVSFAAGDYAAIHVNPTGTPTASFISVSVIFAPTVANDTVIFSFGTPFSTSATQAVMPFSSINPAGVSFRRFSVLPDGGTVDKLHAGSNAPGAGTSYAYTVDKNGATTTVTCTIADAATTCSDATNSFSVAGPSGVTPGDDLEFEGAPTNTPAAASTGFGVRYVPTTTGSFPLMLSSSTLNSTTATTYYPVTGGAGMGSATEAAVQGVADSMTITRIAVKFSAAPGAGKNRVVTLRKNGVDTALTCTVSDTDTACTATGSVAVANDDLLSTAEVPSAGSPTASNPAISYLANR